MQKRVVLSIFLGLMLTLAITSLVLAEDNTNVTAPSNESTNVSSKWEDRCAAVENRVAGRINQFNEGRDKHLISLDNLRNRLSNAADKMDERGFNTTQLRADIIILDEKINKTRADYALFIQKLENTRNFTCGHSEGQFLAALNESRVQLKVVREDIQDIKKFFRETINKDIKEMKKEAREAAKEQREEIKKNITELKEKIKGLRNNTEENETEDNNSA